MFQYSEVASWKCLCVLPNILVASSVQIDDLLYTLSFSTENNNKEIIIITPIL